MVIGLLVSDNFSRLGGFLIFLKIPELCTTTKCSKIIALNKVRGVMKTSFQWLLNGVKQQNPTVLFDFVSKA